jgi:hypothetical protein
MKITGTVIHEDLEGGFWGLVGDDGEKYRPVDSLPETVRKDGCRIEADVEPVQAFSFAMWGRNVRVHSIEKL